MQDASINYRLNTLALWGWQTQRSQIELRPRVQFQEFPDREGIDPVEYFLDLRTEHHTLTSEFGLFARYAHQDMYNANMAKPVLILSIPIRPPQMAVLCLSAARRRDDRRGGVIRHQFTELTSMSGLLSYKMISYSDQLIDRVGYKSPYAELMLTRAFGPVAELSIGPYASHSEADDGSNETDTVGAKVSLYYKWSPTVYFTVAGAYERNEVTDFAPTRTQDTLGDWGLEFSGYYERRIGSVRYAIGRYLTPSTLGTRSTKDQVRVQYIRPLSALLDINGSVRVSREERIREQGGEVRKRALTELSLARQITRTWYVSCGYRYVWQDLGGNVDADNNGVFLSFGYSGLDPRRAQTP